MNKTEYVAAFSKVHPSDEAVERIMDMTNRKKNKSFRRLLITAVVIISLVCSVGVIANAATDGAVGEAISEAVEVVTNKVIVLINGEKTEQEIILEEGVGKDGEPYYMGEISVTSPEGETESVIEFELDGSGAAIGIGGSAAEDIDAVIADEFKLYIPTTAVAE